MVDKKAQLKKAGPKMNQEIRSLRMRVIGSDGSQLGVLGREDALERARKEGLDLVEIAPNAQPPVCKIIDYGKLRYEQAKREKESRKAQHQIKVKEVKFKPTIDEHDFQFKLKRARSFVEKGNKVRITCMFRGREVVHPQVGQRVMDRMCKELEDLGVVESSGKMGRMIHVIIAPQTKATQKKTKGENHAQSENQ